jgi:mRNA interferase MazF
MKAGEVVLIRLTQFGGGAQKLRPALLLAALPGPYQSHLLCGISTQIFHLRPDWDELIQPGDIDFSQSGLHRASIVRLSYLHATDSSEIAGVIGNVDPVQLDRLLIRLANHLHP